MVVLMIGPSQTLSQEGLAARTALVPLAVTLPAAPVADDSVGEATINTGRHLTSALGELSTDPVLGASSPGPAPPPVVVLLPGQADPGPDLGRQTSEDTELQVTGERPAGAFLEQGTLDAQGLAGSQGLDALIKK